MDTIVLVISIILQLYPMLAYLGGTEIDEHDHVRSARAIKLSFIMDGSTETLMKASRILSQVKTSFFNATLF